jgi:anti-sigma B factor antagonist
VRGEIDLVTSPKLVVAGREALREGATSVTVDLCAVTFMDSSGLAALINLHRAVERGGGRLDVTCPEGPVRRVFELSATEALLGVSAPQLAG